MTADAAVGWDWIAAGRTWLGALGAVLVAGSLFWTAGPLGLLAGGLVAVAWALVPGPYAVAGGHVVVLPVLGGSPDLLVLVALETGFLAILVAPTARDAGGLRDVSVTGLFAVGLGAIAWLGWQAWQPRWLVGIVIGTLVAIGLYGLHRYSVVVLELEGVELRA